MLIIKFQTVTGAVKKISYKECFKGVILTLVGMVVVVVLGGGLERERDFRLGNPVRCGLGLWTCIYSYIHVYICLYMLSVIFFKQHTHAAVILGLCVCVCVCVCVCTGVCVYVCVYVCVFMRG